MKDKKNVIILVLVLVLLIGGASVLYTQLGKDNTTDQLIIHGENDGEKDTEAAQQSTSAEDGTESTQQSDKHINKAPDFTVYDADGKAVKLSDYVGKPVVLNFWASWCGPCQSEMPAFDAMYKKYGDRVTFMMVDLTDGSRDTVESAAAFIKARGYSFPVYFDTTLSAASTYGAYSIPMTVLTVLSVLSVEKGLIFSIDEMNHYSRGVLYPVQPVLAYLYPMDTAIRALVRGTRTHDYNVRARSFALASFAVPPFACMMVQALLPPGMPLLCVGMTVALLHVFLSFQEQMISQDQLTELNNRHQLMRHLSSRLAFENRGHNLYLLMIDVDHFKSINDEYGHLEGDSALVLVARALHLACTGKNDFLCRYGGDEFIVVHEADNHRDVEALCDRIRLAAAQISAGKPYELRLSIGYAQHGPNAVIARELISHADRELYRRRRTGGHHVA